MTASIRQSKVTFTAGKQLHGAHDIFAKLAYEPVQDSEPYNVGSYNPLVCVEKFVVVRET